QLSGGSADMSTQANPVAAEGQEVDGIWDDIISGAKDLYNTGKKYAKKTLNKVTHTDPINFIPFGSHLPANVKAISRMAAANLGLGKGVPFVQKQDFTVEDLEAMQNASENLKKRQAANKKAQMKYSDYNKPGDKSGKYTKVWAKNPLQMVSDPTRVVQTSLGRFTPKFNQNGLTVTDHYDFSNEGGNNLLSRFLKGFDATLPQNDPRRNINFNIEENDCRDENCTEGNYKNGGLYKAADGVSIVDYLAERGRDFSKEARKKLAAEKGIKDYDFSAEKNLELLAILRSEEKQGTPSAPVRKPVSTGKQPIVTPGPSTGRFGNYDTRNNAIQYVAPDIPTVVRGVKTTTPVTSTMTEGQRTSAMIKAADEYTPSWKKKQATSSLPDKTAAKKEAKTKSSQYVDLQQMYGLNPFSKEGIMKAQEIARTSPNTRFVCTAEGCSEIAVNAAEAFGNHFSRGNAWNLGNLNKVIAQNPVYASEIGKRILHNPTNYNAPVSVYQHP
ncbi:MAG: hypothetical protein EBZ47_09050, partial [Chlamydiae bacterium]|nr:hypothetical protein [Chlamydiota bacterium]